MVPSISTRLGSARLQAFRRWVWTVTSGMGSSSPAEVLSNLIRILEGASPRLRLAIALTTPWAMLAGALAGYTRVWSAINTVKNYVADSIYASVIIGGTHPLQKQVLAYVVEQGLGKHAKTLKLASAQRDPNQIMNRYYDQIYGRETRMTKQQQRHTEPEDEEKPPLSYVPQVGSYAFWWNGRRITLEQRQTIQQEQDHKGRYHWVQTSVAEIELSCFSLFGGAAPIRDFLKFVQNIPTKERTTTIYRPQATNWDAGIVQSSRNLNAVTMDATIKDSLVEDVNTYLAPATKKYYANRGIPYRRGFLFYGPPGTGKTSFANAIAGHFNLNVYMISLSTKALSDDMLEGLFEQLPNKCIVLLEDIDSAGIKRENMREKKGKKTKKSRRSGAVDQYGDPIYIPPAGITLSGLLNVLDGIHSREGMITIMTSNTPDSLDPALVRPGRIDRKVLFSYASKEVSAKLFRHIFEKTPEERVEGETAESEHDIMALSLQFAETIPADKLTPGDVQGFLLVHRADPVGAVREARKWADKTLEIKNKGANVAAFEGATTTNPADGEAESTSIPGFAELSADEVKQEESEDGTQPNESTDSQDEEDDSSDELSRRPTNPFPNTFSAYPSSYSRMPMPRSHPLGGLPGPGSQVYNFNPSTAPVSVGGPSSYQKTMALKSLIASIDGEPGGGLPAVAGRSRLSVNGQPTPPYSRSASTSPSVEGRAGEGGEKRDGETIAGGEEGKKDDEE